MTTKIASRTLRQFQDLARRHGLPPQAADQMMAVHDGHMTRLTQQRNALQAKWAEQARTDGEYGRCNFPTAVHTARQAVERFGGDKLRQTLDATCLGSHPEIIRAFWKIGKAMNGQAPAVPPRGRPSHEDTLRALYPSMCGDKI